MIPVIDPFIDAVIDSLIESLIPFIDSFHWPGRGGEGQPRRRPGRSPVAGREGAKGNFAADGFLVHGLGPISDAHRLGSISGARKRFHFWCTKISSISGAHTDCPPPSHRNIKNTTWGGLPYPTTTHPLSSGTGGGGQLGYADRAGYGTCGSVRRRVYFLIAHCHIVS